MANSHTIRAHAKEVWSDLPLPNFVENDSFAKLQIILKQGILEKFIVRPA